MWISDKVLDWFKISQESFTSQREEIASLRSERDLLRIQVTTLQNNAEWMRMQVNTLQVERTVLMQKAYGAHLPTPELMRPTPAAKDLVGADIFEDMGDEMAKKLGFPTYGDRN